MQTTYHALNKKYGMCPILKKAGEQCSGHWFVARGGGQDGCSGYLSGDPGPCKGGHFACQLSSSDCPAVLDKLQREGPLPEVASGETCSFIAPKASSSGACLRHGGILPPLDRSGLGACPVIARLYVPTTKTPGTAT